ncbi:divergent polysaccharide deacetylase family protein [Kordiimonas aquimaris]|uniref:divergent polysaccharide deacetylase family protein n=1 Tax=Kordiimonas aquimaris TaxID=707591 RepID=UPI0021D32448|nr:divergent polysaccharide deacetylase family protein [Kordiimonas aquimaris]
MTALLEQNTAVSSVNDLGISQAELTAIVEEYAGTNTDVKTPELVESKTLQLSENYPSSTANRAAWTHHAVNWSETDKPKIAIIIDDLGLDEEATYTFAKMTGPLTLAYLPYAEHLEAQTKLIREAGHELMVHLPMQSQRETADPGDNALLADLTFDEFSKRLEWNLSRFDNYVGINNHMGSSLTENPGLMVRVMARLKRDGHLFVDSLTTPDSVGVRAANAVNVPYAKRDVFLDNERNPDYIRGQIATLERIARKRGYAVGIGHPYPETITELKRWQETLEGKELQLVPISQIVNITNERRKIVTK